MAISLFSSRNGLLRGNLHGHSTHSDGRNSPADVVRLYRAAGYDFTCLSEHYWSNPRFCAATLNDASGLDRDDFITLLSAELHCPGKLYDGWHIVANGLPPVSRWRAHRKPARTSSGAPLRPAPM